MTVPRLARAAAIVALLGLVSRLLGYAREAVLANTYGATGATDAFVNALLLVNSVAAVLLYTLVTLVVPLFQQERTEGGEASAWRLMWALAAWTGAVLVVLSSAAAIWPEGPAALFGLDPAREEATGRLVRIMAPALALQGFSALFTALLQVHGRFAGPAAVGIAFNLGIIVAILVGQGSLGIEAAGWGVAAGAALQVALQLPQFRRLVRAAGARPALVHPRLRAVGWLAVPVMGASILQQVNSFTDKLLASTLEAGRVTALSYANALGQAPRAALLLPLLTPLFPVIAGLMADRRRASAVRAFERAAGLLGLLAVPMTVIMAVYAREVTQVAFGHGACRAYCVDQTASPLVFYALGTWGSFLGLLCNRTLAAAGRQREIILVTALTVAITIALDLALLGPLEQAGLALAATVGVWFNAVALLLLLDRRLPELSPGRVGRQAARLGACGAAALGAALVMELALPADGDEWGPVVPALAAKAAVVVVAYLAAARALAPRELAEGRSSLRALASRRRTRE